MFFHFDSLRKLNPALCYAFEPETDYRIDINAQPINYYQFLKGYVSQQMDMYKTLTIAEHELLPQLNHGFIDLNAGQFIDIIKTIHENVAKTVLGFYDLPSGYYATMTVSRWKTDLGALHKPVCDFLDEKTPILSIKNLAEKLGIDPVNFQRFLDLLVSIKNNDLIQADERFLIQCDPSSRMSVETFGKLQVAYHTDLLTNEEKLLINQFVKVCIFPDQIDTTMNAFAQDAVSRLKSCDINNIDSISSTLAEIFDLLTTIHPFVNGNARTATVLINLLLCAMEKPSILLRYPGETADKSNSPYYNATTILDTTRKPLALLIKDRLNADRYDNDVAKKSTLSKHKLLLELEDIEHEFGLPSAENTLTQIVNAFSEPLGYSQKEIELIFADFALNALKIMRQTWQIETQRPFE